MGIEFEDKTGQIRTPKEFARARTILQQRFVQQKMITDPELMIEVPTILEALRIAEVISRNHAEKKAGKT